MDKNQNAKLLTDCFTMGDLQKGIAEDIRLTVKPSIKGLGF